MSSQLNVTSQAISVIDVLGSFSFLTSYPWVSVHPAIGRRLVQELNVCTVDHVRDGVMSRRES